MINLVGISATDYSHLQFLDINRIDAHTQTGISTTVVTNRLSYFYNLLGPSFIIDTTCSSTLFSLNCACQRIRSGESRSALCGTVNLMMFPDITIGFSNIGVLSPDGQCKAFDASANGYVRSESAGVILQKPLFDAQRNGCRILVDIRGTATYSNGKMELQMASLSEEQQVWLFDRVLRESNVFPSEVNYVEAHGREKERPIVVGSVKSNVGHLEPAAGIVSLIKVAYALKHNLIPPTISAHTLNPQIDMKALILKITTQIQSQPAAANENQPRTGTVSAFEFRETNVSLIVFKAKVRLVNVLRFWLYLDQALKHLY
ncbi:MAG: putative type I polyketide synthase [Streblomastix strix]|uniref:Putative type I polyketide synthase n=1 Tax=Streblomastix strix TaxID=222440 RepID=A0A5J4WQM6_9EUKA|nr:MAG: putative type I polyketide synthase [Streblomastix strix]